MQGHPENKCKGEKDASPDGRRERLPYNRKRTVQLQ